MHHKNANTYGINVLCGCENSRVHFTRCGHAASGGEHWQTDQMVSAYLALVASRFSRLGKLVLALDFTVVGSIFTGLGIKHHLEQDAQLPLSSVSA